jgi:hypothetical protein
MPHAVTGTHDVIQAADVDGEAAPVGDLTYSVVEQICNVPVDEQVIDAGGRTDAVTISVPEARRPDSK